VNQDISPILANSLNSPFLTSMWNPEGKIPNLKEIAPEYKKKIGENMEYKAATYYRAVYVLKNALERCTGSDRDAIRDALVKTNLKAAEKGNINA
jgi:ABC-type branched-subunit amino acid transport system substrate-binding protein